MVTPIVEYEVVEFDSEEESLAFTSQLEGFIRSPEGVPFITGPRGAEALELPVFDRVTTIYLSSRAADAAKAAGLCYVASGRVKRSDLPPNCVRLFG